MHGYWRPGARATNDISIEFEILWNFVMLLFSQSPQNFAHVTTVTLSWRVQMWSVDRILKQSTANFDRISNSIEIPLVGREPGYSLIKAYDVIIERNNK